MRKMIKTIRSNINEKGNDTGTASKGLPLSKARLKLLLREMRSLITVTISSSNCMPRKIWHIMKERIRIIREVLIKVNKKRRDSF